MVLKFRFDYRYAAISLENCASWNLSDHQDESRHDAMNAHQPRSQIRGAFSRFLSLGAFQESSTRENTSYVAPISIDLPSFRSVRSRTADKFFVLPTRRRRPLVRRRSARRIQS